MPKEVEFFDDVARQYDAMHPYHGHHHLRQRMRTEIQEAYVWLARDRPLSDVLVLEVCAGTGVLTEILLQAGPVHVDALEPSAPMRNLLAVRLEHAGVLGRCTPNGYDIDGWMEALGQLKDNRYDMIAIKQGFGILPGDVEVWVEKLAGFLNPHAAFYVAEEFIEESRMSPEFYRWYSLLTEIDESLRPDVAEYYRSVAGSMEARRVSAERLRKALEELHFRVQTNYFCIRSNEAIAALATAMGAVNAFSMLAFREGINGSD